MEVVLIALVFQALVFGFFAGYIAGEKGRSFGTWFVLGFFFSILAVLALIAVPKVAPLSRNFDVPQQLFDGQRDIALPAYQLFLTKRFGVEKNNTIEKFVIGNDVYEDLPSALADADARYGQQLVKLEAEKLQRQREAPGYDATTNPNAGPTTSLNASCPRCSIPISIDASKCKACDANFKGRRAKWSPIPIP